MNRLINIVASSRFFKGDIGYHLVLSPAPGLRRN